jgi:hypothetical protein
VARTRRRIDSALKAKIALDALRGQKSIADLARQYGLHPNQIYAYKKQLQIYAVYAFDRPIRQIAELQAKVSGVERYRDSPGPIGHGASCPRSTPKPDLSPRRRGRWHEREDDPRSWSGCAARDAASTVTNAPWVGSW